VAYKFRMSMSDSPPPCRRVRGNAPTRPLNASAQAKSFLKMVMVKLIIEKLPEQN